MISNFQFVWGDTPWVQRDTGMYRPLQSSGFSPTVGGDFVPMVGVLLTYRQEEGVGRGYSTEHRGD